MNILSVKNLSVDYKTSFGIVNAVKDVSFNVEKGASFVIVGRSGSGKSTVASAIMGLTEIDGGKIISGGVYYNGKEMLQMPFEEKRKIRGKKILRM